MDERSSNLDLPQVSNSEERNAFFCHCAFSSDGDENRSFAQTGSDQTYHRFRSGKLTERMCVPLALLWEPRRLWNRKAACCRESTLLQGVRRRGMTRPLGSR